MNRVTLLNYNGCYKDNGERYTEAELNALKQRFQVGGRVTVDGKPGVFKRIIEDEDGLYAEVDYTEECQ